MQRNKNHSQNWNQLLIRWCIMIISLAPAMLNVFFLQISLKYISQKCKKKNTLPGEGQSRTSDNYSPVKYVVGRTFWCSTFHLENVEHSKASSTSPPSCSSSTKLLILFIIGVNKIYINATRESSPLLVHCACVYWGLHITGRHQLASTTVGQVKSLWHTV